MELVRFIILTTVSLCAGSVRTETTEAPPSLTIPPLIAEEPPKLVPYMVEEFIELPCVATGEPEPEYRWTLNDVLFDPTGNENIYMRPGEGTLVFVRPFERDQGIYQCMAQNEVGTALTVKIDFRMAYLEPFPSGAVVTHRPCLGDSRTLRCIPPASFPQADVFWATWSQEEQRFDPIDLDDRVTMDPIGNLHFVNVQAEDEMGGQTYACVVDNNVTRSIEQGEYARIVPEGQSEVFNYPDLLWTDPTHQMALRGHTWRVKCIFGGNPTPNVTWTRIGAPFPEGRWRQESYGQELVIENVQMEDTGTYECEGINDISSVPIRKSFFLTVEAEPFWVTRPTSIDGAEGDTAVFTCEAAGIPEPVNFWFINGVPTEELPFDPNRVVEETTMTFLNLTKDYAQVVQCNSTNKHGYVYANAYLNVLTESPIILGL